VFLHDGEEFDDYFGGRPDEDLALSCLFSIVDGVETVVEDGGADHGGGGGETAGRVREGRWGVEILMDD
jgi:hypothetical protein